MKRNEERINVLVGPCKEHHSYSIFKGIAQKSKETNSLPQSWSGAIEQILWLFYMQHVSTQQFARMKYFAGVGFVH